MLRIPSLLRATCCRELRTPSVNAQQLLVRTAKFQARTRKPVGRPSRARSKAKAFEEEDNQVRLLADDVPVYFSRNVHTWLSQYNQTIADRLARFGVPKDDLRSLLRTYTKAMNKGDVFRHLSYSGDQLSRIARDMTSNSQHAMDRYFTRMLFEWTSLPEGQEALETVVSPKALARMQSLFRAADLSNAGWEYTHTRGAPPRKFIMHVGPTNSGKTHNALRALAAAKRGVYAGPLRLLAFEIFDRLNKGQIVPLGMEPDPQAEPDSQSNIDSGDGAEKGKAVIVKTGNPRYARQCNMVTGEEHKIVSDTAPLLSCTVEMTPHATYFDVAVVDEIQLISDRQRGGAWTAAVLGLNAREIHLCGEESAVPLIEALVKQTGDTLEVNRYNRLTPLVVADKSLNGDISRIKKGDCVVTFSRMGLFELQKNIEEATKMRCALAYGRLPPEIRSEQAALFNDPNSGYDVLVGSDAVGMGLNLKIRRVVFETVSKFDGTRGQRPLSASQIKQIAGRAGRFGMHGDDTAGIVTTLHPGDLDLVREALATSFEPLHTARLNMTMESYRKIVEALPWESSNITVAEVYHYVSRMSPLFEFQSIHELEQGFLFIDDFADCLTLPMRLLATNSPTPWRDDFAVTGARTMMEIYRDSFRVPIDEMLRRGRLLKKLNSALVLMEGRVPAFTQKDVVPVLAHLETLHKVIALYLWFSYRHPVAFPDQEKAFKLRHLNELAMDWCLEVLHQMRLKTKDPAAQARKTVLDRRPLTKQEVTLAESDSSNSEKTSHEKVLSDKNDEFISHIVR
ncbi:P-loop containing nucleoside triphosphate hydrolase protein [Dichomitus squalens]|uniref:P-loop containing nucleoside triphosphate hydrolase protein n=1 Tax=Dichomitus squalens TaxID=114155 RepID=A0A4Q9PRU8_9APHY|nr:P-loop containing nucleoside triphosphate hydrolase protein [Dichomitus squalens]TBU57014.1 P-loop containing nucleoside triphosphate hydrolase protein [Dichomitus squalens]